MKTIERNCGSCTACCFTHGVEALEKMPARWCKNCNVGSGCKIYSKRPKACIEFKCTWIHGLGNLEHRPDKIGIVSELRHIESVGVHMGLWECRQVALHTPLARTWTLNNLYKGVSVLHIPQIAPPKFYLADKIKPENVPAKFMFSNRQVLSVPYEQALFEFRTVPT